MQEFLNFLGRNCIAGWQFGYGVFAFIEAACIVAIASAKWWPRKPDSRVDLDEVEGAIMKWAALVLLISFVTSTLFVAPFIQFRDSEATRRTAEQNVTMFSNKWETASAFSERKKAAHQKKEVDDANKRLQSVEDSARQRDKELVAAVKSPDPGRAVLQVIADRPVAPPETFDLKAGEGYLADMERKAEAKEAIQKIDEGRSELMRFSNCAPAFDYCLRTLNSGVEKLAQMNSDRIVDGYIGLPGFGRPGFLTNDYTTWIRLSTNSAWNFKIWFKSLDSMDIWCDPKISSTVERVGRDKINARIAVAAKEVFNETCPTSKYQETVNKFITLLLAVQNRQAPITNALPKR